MCVKLYARSKCYNILIHLRYYDNFSTSDSDYFVIFFSEALDCSVNVTSDSGCIELYVNDIHTETCCDELLVYHQGAAMFLDF